MVAHCAHCGQKLRDGWQRCPRCHARIEELGAASIQSPRVAWRKVAALCAVLVVGAIAVSLVRSSRPHSGASDTEIRDYWPSSLALPAQPRSSDLATAPVHQAIDSVRAGNAAYAQGNLDAALEQYAAAVAASPNHAEARNNLAQVLVRRGEVTAALPHLDVAVTLAPDRWAYRFNRARAYGAIKRWQAAADEYQVALTLFPDDYATYYNLGLALISLRRFGEAIDSLEQAIALAPEEHSFLIALGTACVGAEQPLRARTAFQQFLERAPQGPEGPRVRALLEAMAAAGQ